MNVTYRLAAILVADATADTRSKSGPCSTTASGTSATWRATKAKAALNLKAAIRTQPPMGC